jgi:hypothetical protein
MSQFDEVSNIANPTFDAELAISMTVNATLPKTPQRQSPAEGASDLAVDSLDNKIPIGRARNWLATACPILDQMANSAQSFKAPQCKKRPQQTGCVCSKSELLVIPTNPVGPCRHLIRVCAKQFQCTPLSWLFVSLNHVATNSTNFASVWRVSKQNSGPLWRAQMRHSATAVCAHGRSAA